MKFTTATATNTATIGLLPASRTGLDVAVGKVHEELALAKKRPIYSRRWT